MNAKSIAFAAFATLAFASGAQAFQGEENPLPPQPFQSTLSRGQVQADARQPFKITNGGTGALQPRNGSTEHLRGFSLGLRIITVGGKETAMGTAAVCPLP